MFFGSMAFVFEVMLYVGLGLPLVNLLLGLLGGAGHSGAELGGDADLSLEMDADVDFDLDPQGIDAEMDVNAAETGGAQFPLRFNVYCLCLALVVMGAVGVFAVTSLEGAASLAVLIGGAFLALAAYTLLYRFVIRPLKKNNADALKVHRLRFRHALVTFRIIKDSPGKISTCDAVGARITYRAELDPDICKLDRIDEGEEVVITEINREENFCYVTLAQRKILS